MMGRIRGKHTAPEMAVRRAFHAAGLRFRLHSKMPGRPDLVLPKYRSVVFVHGCFWHRHECVDGRVVPKTRTEFWQAKLTGNARRDTNNVALLEAAGWRVFVVWECEVNPRKIESIIKSIRDQAGNARGLVSVGID
jgi:DNA mismatch endonuclease (patch repair protein)